MASAVTVIFGANSTQFQAELARMQTMTMAASRRMSAQTLGGHIQGMSGLIREGITIPREIIEGRGIGRVIGSLSLFSQYLHNATKGSAEATDGARLLANAYAEQSLKANLAAAAAMKKAEADAAAAEMDGFEDEASIKAADASALQAATANAAAVALEKKAAAAEADAVAQEALAASTAGATSAFSLALGFMIPFALLLVILAEVYVIYKSLATIIGRTAVAQKEAADYTREHTLASWEEIEALEKLKDASEKTTEAIKKMNEAKDRQVQLAREAIDASNAESDAKSKLNDAATKSKMLDVDIAEKKGIITHRQAIQKKADIESLAIAEKAAQEQAKLDAAAKISSDAAKSADIEKGKANAAAQAASDKINKSPEGKKRAEMLAQAEKDLQASKQSAESAAKDRDAYSPGMNFLYNSSLAARLKGFHGAADQQAALKEQADAASNAAASAEIRVNSLKRFMSPDEQAAAEALRIAGERNSAAISLHDEATKTATAAGLNAANSPAEVAAQQANIAKQAALDLIPKGDAKGYSLNSQQRIGAYAATAPILLQQLNELRGIKANTAHATPSSNHPPGERKPQLGTRPSAGGYVNGSGAWVPDKA